MISVHQLIVMFGNFHHVSTTQNQLATFHFETGHTNEVSKNMISRNLADAICYYITTGIEA
jgi:hypothetical protein